MRSRLRWALLLLAVILAPVIAAASARAAPVPGRDTADRCAALVGTAFSDVPNAPTRIVSAKVVPTQGKLPAYCDVLALVQPNVGVGVRLPIDHWNGKFFLLGRGGYCRAITMDPCDAPLRKGYACAVTDQGHKTNESDDVWIYGNTQAKVDCGFRGTHVATLAAKAVTTRFYGTPPVHAYFFGCSTGGRMGLVEAERFPYDFDGIVAGAAPVGKSVDSLGLMWGALAMMDKTGAAVLTADDLRFVAKAALASCDGDDGLKDGVISDPFHCRFDPIVLQCGATLQDQCLSPDKVAAVRKMYQGAVTRSGVRLVAGGLLPGSELNWIQPYLPQTHYDSIIGLSATTTFRYMVEPERGPDWKITDFDWDKDYKTDSLYESFMTAENPDLRAFKTAGGKLIIYHGLADEYIMPRTIVDFYSAVSRVMGGPAKTADFARLFLVPGMNHCTGGAGVSSLALVQALETWVEAGSAPDVILGAHLKAKTAGTFYEEDILPPAPSNVAFTRPIYPYPLTTIYTGTGDPNDAASFKPGKSDAPSGY